MIKFRITLCLFTLFCTFRVEAQQAQPILGIAKENKSITYYKQQSSLWKKKTDRDPTDAYAWYQRYKAERAFLQKTHPQTWSNNQPEIFAKLRPIIAQSKIHVDNSYEYYLMEAMSTSTKKSIEYTKRAYEIDPERSETYGRLLVYHITRFEESEAQEIARKMLKRNIYSNANLKWNYNTLRTVDKDGVFVANGDMDAIPKWVLQYGSGIRKDALVVSKWTLSNDQEYREKVFRKVGVPKPKRRIYDFENPSLYVDYLVTEILKKGKRPSYMGCGTDVHFFEKNNIEDHMYLVGTAFVYADKTFDNLSVTISNFEKKYDLEYLINNFQVHPEEIFDLLANKKYSDLSQVEKRQVEEFLDKSEFDHYHSIVKDFKQLDAALDIEDIACTKE